MRRIISALAALIVSAGIAYAEFSGPPVQPLTCAASNWINSISAGLVPSCARPACADLSNAGGLCTAAAGTFIARQIFTSTATYTATVGATVDNIRCIGSGGGGGGAATTTGTTAAAGAGGGAGGYSERRVLAATATGSTVTIGAAGTAGAAGANAGGTGGNVTFGALLTANGGVGGGGGVANTIDTGSGNGAAGGTAAAGDINVPGQSTIGTTVFSIATAVSSSGGNSQLGAGGPGVITATATAGNAASGFGAGGSGGAVAASNTQVAGGAGSKGVCIVDEYE